MTVKIKGTSKYRLVHSTNHDFLFETWMYLVQERRKWWIFGYWKTIYQHWRITDATNFYESLIYCYENKT